MDVLHQFLIFRDGSVDVLLRGTIDIVMTLHTDTVDGYTSILHLLHHIIYTVALARVALVVVVVEQQGVGSGLTGKLESLGNKLVTTELVVTAVTIRTGSLTTASEAAKATKTTTIGDGFVHDIPAINDVLVTIDNGVDVIAQTLIEYLLLDGLTFLVGKHPVGKL